MTNLQLRQLKSESDIRGIATGVSGQINLTNVNVKSIALAFAIWISKNKNMPYDAMTIAVGSDPRISSTRIKTCLINALISIGIKVYDCSITSTPAMFMSVSSLTCTASVQITASHHPADRNGFKFFTDKGPLMSGDLESILDIAEKQDFPPIAKALGKVKPINMMNYYCEKIKSVIAKEMDCKKITDKPLKGLKVTVDAGNGSGGFFAHDILKSLGADTSSSIFLEPNGNFPNHSPNPEDLDAIDAISKAVIESKSDIGIIFDPDVDRVNFVDFKGKIINKSRFIAFVSSIVLKENPGSTIITDSVPSDKVSEYINDLGGVHIRYKRGYKNIIEYAKKMQASGVDCPVAIESSGHVALRENDFIDDGAYLAAKVIAKVAKMKNNGILMDEIMKDFVNAREEMEIRIPIFDPRVISCSRKVMISLKDYVKEIKSSELETNSIEGVRIKFNTRWQEGWCILRKSLHDPSLVLNIESYVTNGALSILNSLIPFFKKFQFISVEEIDKQVEVFKKYDSVSSEV